MPRKRMAKGDEIVLNVPMKLSQTIWEVNQNSRSIHYGPLTFSLKIAEDYQLVSSTETAIGDSKWQKMPIPPNGLPSRFIRQVPGIMLW